MTETAHRSWTYAGIVAEGLDPDRFEVVNGELVEVKSMGIEGGRIFARVARLLDEHVERRALGVVYITSRFLLAEDPRLERRPDLAFVSTRRLPEPEDPDLFPGAPDLAVEILSPSDTTAAACDKAGEYLDAGAREAWIVDPKLQTITVLRSGRPARAYSIGDSIEGAELLPGLSLELEQLFAPPAARTAGPDPR